MIARKVPEFRINLCTSPSGKSLGARVFCTAKAAINPADSPIAIVLGCSRMAPFAMRVTEIFFSARISPSVSAGINDSIRGLGWKIARFGSRAQGRAAHRYNKGPDLALIEVSDGQTSRHSEAWPLTIIGTSLHSKQLRRN